MQRMMDRRLGVVGATTVLIAAVSVVTAIAAIAAAPHQHRLHSTDYEGSVVTRNAILGRVNAKVGEAVPTYVSQIAERVASEMGDSSPATSTAVLTTRGPAEGLTSGAQVDSDGQVYLVELTGNFVDKAARVGPGAPFPTGNEVDFTIDTQSQTIMDLHIGNTQPDLSSLGSVSSVSLGQ